MATVAAAIYARLSHQRLRGGEQSESIERQIENATAFAVDRDWTVATAHMFSDDGVHGGTFTRPALSRLMGLLKPRAPFQKLVVAERKAIGREDAETSYLIKKLAQAGVEVFEYVHGRSLTPRTPIEQVQGSLQGYADADHRVKTSERVHEAHTRSVKAGHVVGSRVYGYRNVDIFNGTDDHGRPLRSYVDRAIDPTEARVIRQIFELSAEGHGFKAIAKILNASGIATPGGSRMWHESSVRGLLFNPIYKGVVIWNRTKKKDDYGEEAPSDRPETQWVRVPTPKWRIVSDMVWDRAHVAMALRRRSYLASTKGERHGRPPVNSAARHRHLLTGYMQCACGSRLEVRSRWHGRPGHRSRRVNFLVCAANVRRGDTTCTNHRMIPMLAANESVLSKIEEKLLTPEFIERTIAAVMKRIPSRAEVTAERATIDGRLKKVQSELSRLVEKFAESGSATIAAAITRRETELAALQKQLTEVEQRPVQWSSGMTSRIEAMAIKKIAEFKRLMHTQTPIARRLLGLVLRGRICFRAQGRGGRRGFRWDADASALGLLDGIVAAGSTGVERATGIEPVSEAWEASVLPLY